MPDAASYAPLESPPAQRSLGALGVAVLLFGAVAGGPYGIEPAVGLAGGLPTLLGLVIVAITWACTQAFLVAELSTLVPSNSGYVGWVLKGLGPRAGFVNAQVCCLQQILNIPLYAVLSCNSLEQLVGTLSPGAEYGVKLAVVVIATTVNIFGLAWVERISGVMIVLVQTPFIIMPIVWAASGHRHFEWHALTESVPGWTGNSAVFLATLAWNMQGWTVVGNVSGEVLHPSRNLPLGICLAVAAVSLNYIWPLIFTIAMSPPPLVPDASIWGTGYFVGLATQTSAPLGAWAAVCAVLSCLSNFIPQLATSSRALQAMARARMVPQPLAAWLAVSNARFRTPINDVFFLVSLVCGLMVLDFSTLVTTQILLALVGLVLQFAAFLRLKHLEPDAHRPFSVPGGKIGAWLLSAPFFVLAGIITWSNIDAGVEGWASCAAVGGVTLLFVGCGEVWTRTVYDDAVLAQLMAGGEAAEAGEALLTDTESALN